MNKMKKELEFKDFKTKKKFHSREYDITIKNNTRFALTKTPSGGKASRIVSKDFNPEE